MPATLPATVPVNLGLAAQIAPVGDPKRAVIAALQAQMTAGPYRMHTTVVSANGVIELMGEMIPPDRLHMFMKRGDFTSESIYIGARGWKKVDGRWTPSPLDASQIWAKLGEKAAEELEKSIGNVQAAGSDTVNGQPALVYTYTSTGESGGTGQVVSALRLWVSIETGLPIMVESQGEVMGVESTTTQWVEHDPTIAIEPPLP